MTQSVQKPTLSTTGFHSAQHIYLPAGPVQVVASNGQTIRMRHMFHKFTAIFPGQVSTLYGLVRMR